MVYSSDMNGIFYGYRLVGGLDHELCFSHSVGNGMSSSQLTNSNLFQMARYTNIYHQPVTYIPSSNIFQRARAQPPTSPTIHRQFAISTSRLPGSDDGHDSPTRQTCGGCGRRWCGGELSCHGEVRNFHRKTIGFNHRKMMGFHGI